MTIPSSAKMAWVGIIIYGVGNGPAIGYTFDLNNRITIPSETGLAVVTFGINAGASVVPFLAAFVWEKTDQPFYFTMITFLSMIIPVGLVRATKALEKEEIGFMYATPQSADLSVDVGT